MQDKTLVCLRPHHGMCFLNFVGKGYSDSFSKNMMKYKKLFEKNPDVLIKITSGIDDVCNYCPNNINKKCTSSNPDIFDKRVLDMTNLKIGQIISWKDFSQKTDKINKTNIEKICSGCKWLDFCKSIIRQNSFSKKI